MIQLYDGTHYKRVRLPETHAGLISLEEFIICGDRTNIVDLFIQLSYFWDINANKHTLKRGKLFI